MINQKHFKLFINILFIISIIIILNVLYRYFIERNIYKKIDFLSLQINDIDDYNTAKNCVENYLFSSRYDYNNIGYFLHNEDKEKNKKYSEYLKQDSIAIQLKDVKKSIGKVYVVYYKKNDKTDVVNRIVFKINGQKYQVLYDSMYESI